MLSEIISAKKINFHEKGCAVFSFNTKVQRNTAVLQYKVHVHVLIKFAVFMLTFT